MLLGALTPVHRLDENENIEKESAVIFHLDLQTCMLPAKEALMEAWLTGTGKATAVT